MNIEAVTGQVNCARLLRGFQSVVGGEGLIDSEKYGV